MRNAAIIVLAMYVSASPPEVRAEADISQERELRHQAEHRAPTAAYRWLEITLEASGRDVDRVGARPTILARAMAIVLTSMYDAWAAYDDKAVGTRFGDDLRRPVDERTQPNKEAAIAYAAYRSLLFVYPEDAEWIRDQMQAAGFDPDNDTADRTAGCQIPDTVHEIA